MRIKFGVFGVALALILVACNMPSGNSGNSAAATIQAVYTAQAATANAGLGNFPATATPLVAATLAFPTLPPAATTAAPSSAPTNVPATATPQPPVTICDWVAYVKDISVPDGTIFAPGTQFTKTWRLQNIGTCSWTTSYALVFSNGNSMSGPSAVAMPGSVNPGQYVDVSVNLTAPTSEGSYRGYWTLRNGAGVIFGIGGRARDPFFVDIQVVGAMTSVLDFASSYCSATWRSGAGDLGCPGNDGDKKGFVLKVDNPQLENGQIYSGPGLVTVPEQTKNGYIQGYYPAFTVQKGDRFRAIVNCEYLAKGCNVVFQLDYQIGSGPVKNFWHAGESYEGQYYTVDSDLSSLAGEQVTFILTLLSNGSANKDKALWAGPRIERLSDLITPSPTPTPTATITSTTPPKIATAMAPSSSSPDSNGSAH